MKTKIFLTLVCGGALTLAACNGSEFAQDTSDQQVRNGGAHGTAQQNNAELSLEDSLVEDESGSLESGDRPDRVAMILGKFDANDSGALEAEELSELLWKAKRHMRKRGPGKMGYGKRGRGPGQFGGPGQLRDKVDPAEIFACIDTDASSSLDVDEFSNHDNRKACIQSIVTNQQI